MNAPFNAFCDAFPQYNVALNPRPDGSLLLTLSKDDKSFSKVIDGNVCYSEQHAGHVIHELLRDMKLAAGEVTCRDTETDWVHHELPTYYGGAIYMTASKTLVTRRKLEHERQMAKR
ncbi:hypothetical protein D3C85_1118070 [compost metagenome]